MQWYDPVIRLVAAMICGGVIGLERERKRRAAGLRTFMIVCMGASLTMLLGQYMADMIESVWKIGSVSTDVSRFGAQVINGIGFLGAGTILITSRQQVRGMTTASGLWAAACMGLTIGAGFYECAVIGCVLILLATTVMRSFERRLMAKSRNLNIYVEVETINDIGKIIELIKSQNIRIYDVEINKADKGKAEMYPGAIFTVRLPKKMLHTEVLTNISVLDCVLSIEEL